MAPPSIKPAGAIIIIVLCRRFNGQIGQAAQFLRRLPMGAAWEQPQLGFPFGAPGSCSAYTQPPFFNPAGRIRSPVAVFVSARRCLSPCFANRPPGFTMRCCKLANDESSTHCESAGCDTSCYRRSREQGTGVLQMRFGSFADFGLRKPR